MSLRSVALLFFFYFIGAIAIAVFDGLDRSLFTWASLRSAHPVAVGTVIGGSISIYLLSMVLPLVVWAVMRFRLKHAETFFILWSAFAAIVWYLQRAGTGM
jgi:hypothetical protein